MNNICPWCKSEKNHRFLKLKDYFLSQEEFEIIGNVIADVIDAFNTEQYEETLAKAKNTILDLTKKFPIYEN